MHARILFISSCDGKGTCADARACARASSMLFYFSSRECVCAVRRVRGMLSCVRSPSFLSFPHCKQLVTQPILWLHPPPPPPPPSSSEPRLAPRGYCNRGAWARRSAAATLRSGCASVSSVGARRVASGQCGTLRGSERRLQLSAVQFHCPQLTLRPSRHTVPGLLCDRCHLDAWG